jgi:hypothetical protein
MKIGRTFRAQVVEVGDFDDTQGPGVRLDALPDEPGFTSANRIIGLPLTKDIARLLAPHVYETVLVTVTVEPYMPTIPREP